MGPQDETNTAEAPTLTALAPVCPHCLQDPATVKCLGPIRMGQLLANVIFCGNVDCRKVWTVQIMGMDRPAIIPGLIHPS